MPYYSDPHLAVLSDFGDPAAEPLPDANVGHAPGPNPSGQMPYDPHLDRLFQKRTPIEKKFGVRFQFPARTLKSEILERPLELNAFEFVVVSYRWAWTGWRSDRETPISIEYGTSTDSVLRRPQLISAVWGNPRDYAYPARAKIYRKNRQLTFRAQLDWALLGLTSNDESNVPPTMLDIVVDGLELRES